MECRICNNKIIEQVTIMASHPRYSETGMHYNYFFCKKCGCLQETAFPTDYSSIYNDDYFNVGKGTKKSLKDLIYERIMGDSLNSKRGLLGKLIQQDVDYSFMKKVSKDDSILDVGCATGKFLNMLKKDGYTDITGCDPYGDVKWGGVNFYKTDIYNLSSDKKYDCITLINVFEHLEEPDKVLYRLEELLSEKGRIYMILPVINRFLWEKFGTSIWSLSPPEHLFLHTEKSLKQLAKKANLEVMSFETHCSSILWDDKKNVDNGNVSLNNQRSALKSIKCAISTIKSRKRIDDRKLGNIGFLVLKKKDN